MVWKHDNQNVHSSSLNKGVAKLYEQITKKIPTNQYNNIEQIIENYISEDSNINSYKPNVIKMIEIIKKRNQMMSKLKVREYNLLHDIVSYILTLSPEQQKAGLDNVILNLNDAYQNGYPVCATGRVNRIISSIELLTEFDSPIKDFSTLRNEILLKSADIRNKVLDKQVEPLKEKYNNGEETEDVLNLTEEIRQLIKDMIRVEYKQHLSTSEHKQILTEIEYAI